jgi:hypothetical protein
VRNEPFREHSLLSGELALPIRIGWLASAALQANLILRRSGWEGK